MTKRSKTLHKVTGFVTRQRSGEPTELLVFQHPTAGVQLPAGTVEAGEPLQDAAFREVAEETGITELRLKRCLGSMTFDLDNGRRLFLQGATLRAGPYKDAPSLHWTFGRGSWCEQIDEVGGYAEIEYEETNLNVSPTKVRIRFRGWIPVEILSSRLERHFYHFETTGKTAERWVQKAERDFECYWVPLVPKPKLVEGQNEWVEYVYDTLTE